VIGEASTVLRPGDALALYTDGLLEAHAPARTVTAQQIIDRLQERPPALAEDTIATLLELVDLDERVRDDIAILTARVTGGADEIGALQEPADALSSAL
jgi:serine phosphatase RsbU (regulator of sigma subunit)